MRKNLSILAIIIFILAKSFTANAACYRQRNPIGYSNYDICEVEGTGYICVSLDVKSGVGSGISCFLAPNSDQDESSNQGLKQRHSTKKINFSDRKIGEE